MHCRAGKKIDKVYQYAQFYRLAIWILIYQSLSIFIDFLKINCEKLFWRQLWQFFRERRRPAPKINITFLSQVSYWILFYLAVFSKKAAFSEKMAKPQFLEPKSLLKGRGHPGTKMNMTSFIGNEVLNIFSFKNFSEKSNIFREKGEKKFWGTWPFFRRRSHFKLKMNITFFIEN